LKIYFYRVNESYGCFSNFSHHPFELDGKLWKTSEHYFQSQKFIGTPYEDEIRLVESPMVAAKLGRDRSKPLRTDWEIVKDNIMRKAVLEKFKTHQDIQQLLLSTGTNEIIEKTQNDYYWGCGKDGTGKNMLGKILMEVRDSHKTE
jgi:ribA/ribD-fused uncharacterized protein